MNIKMKEVLNDLQEQVVDERLDRAEWNALLASRITIEELALLHDEVSAGKIAFRESSIKGLARQTYPWMFNEYTAPNGNVYPSWYERMEERGVSRPKDLLHLSKLAFLSENYQQLDTFF